MTVVLMMLVYTAILGGSGFLFVKVVKGQHDAEVEDERLDSDVNIVLTLGDEPTDTGDVLRYVWRRVHGSRVFGLRERRRVRRNRRLVANSVPHWS